MKKLKLLKKTDIIIAVVLLLVVFIMIFAIGRSSFGATAYIYKNNKVVEEIKLNEVQSPYDIEYENNNHKLTVHIETGKIRFSKADCPDKICVNTGYLSKNGDTAVCVPSEMMIVVKTDKQGNFMTY